MAEIIWVYSVKKNLSKNIFEKKYLHFLFLLLSFSLLYLLSLSLLSSSSSLLVVAVLLLLLSSYHHHFVAVFIITNTIVITIINCFHCNNYYIITDIVINVSVVTTDFTHVLQRTHECICICMEQLS